MGLLDHKSDKTAVYFKDLTIANIRCFKKEQRISFTNSKGEPAQWTVILGNNNTGKTTLLRCLYDLEVLDAIEHNLVPHNEPNKFLKDEPRQKIFTAKFKDTSLYHNSKTYTNYLATRQDISFEIKVGFWNQESGTRPYSNIYSHFSHLYIAAYGIPRTVADEGLVNKNVNFTNPFTDNVRLVNTQEWLLQTDHASKSGELNAANRLNQIKKILTSILPDVHDFRFKFNENGGRVEFKTDFGWVRLKDLGYGYQSLMAWMVDFAKRLFDRYPESENPLAEAAIVLVDEIDLHLHPDWQRRIIKHLSTHFPRTQFIVTAHSPLVIQSADEVNVVFGKRRRSSTHSAT